MPGSALSRFCFVEGFCDQTCYLLHPFAPPILAGEQQFHVDFVSADDWFLTYEVLFMCWALFWFFYAVLSQNLQNKFVPIRSYLRSYLRSYKRRSSERAQVHLGKSAVQRASRSGESSGRATGNLSGEVLSTSIVQVLSTLNFLEFLGF